MTAAAQNRVVAIVGRPNVGKSALFNRLVRKRLAIVHEESGVTRDRLASPVEHGGERFELIDTGGIGGIDESSKAGLIEQGIRVQAEAALEDAGLVIHVVDAQAGVTTLDDGVAAMLRSSGRQVVVAVNKCDDPSRDSDVDEFQHWGFDCLPVSALNNRGVKDLLSYVVERLPEAEAVEEPEPLRVVVVGKPNVGKSSYINRLLKHERVIVSDIAGTTRDSIEVPFQVGKGNSARHYLLTDTAGVRRRGKVDSTVEYFSLTRTEASIRKADVVVLVLDASTGATAQDRKMAALIEKYNRGFLVLVNKWDLADKTQRAFGEDLIRAFPFMDRVPVVYASAETGYNVRRTIEAIDHVAEQVQATLPTGVLNRTIMEAYQRVQPPSAGGKRMKIYYSVQIDRNPLLVRIFVNDPRGVPVAYRRYLTSTIRDAFGLDGAPIVLQFRARRTMNDEQKRGARSHGG